MPAPSTIPETDFSLLRRFAEDGDEDAFSEIVRRYAGVVFSACHRVLRDRAWAEDVAQETFFRLVKGPDRVSHSLGGWLHRAATRLAVDTLRSERARHRREQTYESPGLENDAGDPGATNAGGGAFGGSVWQEVSPAIDEALDELDDEARELLVRHFLQGTAQADLAEEYGVSAATMSRRVKHAINDLRQRLASRGVTVAPAVLLLMCARNAAELAPQALMGELGKMAMVSGAATKASIVGSIPQWASTAFPSPLKVFRAAAKEWPRVSMCAAVGLGLYLAVPYLPLMRFASENRPQAVREEPRPTNATTAPAPALAPSPQTQQSDSPLPATLRHSDS